MHGDLPSPGAKLTFEQANGSQVFAVEADSTGHFSVTLPPGAYRVANGYAAEGNNIFLYEPNAGQALRVSGSRGLPEVLVTPGEHITVDFAFQRLFQ
jgi:hypothetical protein